MAQMGKIIVNGIEYSGGGDGSSNIVYLTQAEYDSLPDTKLTNGVEYRITDADSSATEARNIAYDNSESGLEAVSVQGAIDKVKDSLNVMGNEYDYIQVNTTGGYDFPFDLSEYRYLHVIMEHKDGYVLTPNMMPLCVLKHDKYYAFSYYDGSINPIIAFCIREDKTVHCNNFRDDNVVKKVFLVLVK